MRVLITRPIEDARRVAERLEAQGIDTLIAPLMTIRPVETDLGPLDDVQAVLLTSANGARALAAATEARGHAVFTVGDATAREAGRLGFKHVRSANGTVEDLARTATEALDPARGVLFHAAGRDRAGDLKGLLEAAGFTVRRAILYRAETSSMVPAEARKALTGGELDGALFFSPRSAQVFADLASGTPAGAACSGVVAYCLSKVVAKAVGELTWRDVKVAKEPDLEHLLHLVEGDAEAQG